MANRYDTNQKLQEIADNLGTNSEVVGALEDIKTAIENGGGGGGGGTTVVPNPPGSPTDTLETVQIANTIYDLPGGGINIHASIDVGSEITQVNTQSVTLTKGKLYLFSTVYHSGIFTNATVVYGSLMYQNIVAGLGRVCCIIRADEDNVTYTNSYGYTEPNYYYEFDVKLSNSVLNNSIIGKLQTNYNSFSTTINTVKDAVYLIVGGTTSTSTTVNGGTVLMYSTLNSTGTPTVNMIVKANGDSLEYLPGGYYLRLDLLTDEFIKSVEGGSGIDAFSVIYDNTTSGLNATDVQEAIDENADNISTLNSKIVVETDTVGGVVFTRQGNIVSIYGYGISPASLPTIPERYRPSSTILFPVTSIASNKLYNAYVGITSAGAMNCNYASTYADSPTTLSGGSIYFTVSYAV